ncbi:hypothetical protein CALVIDRAFT_563274 [Calocera viscosa TUFC12733]|uniref:Membrane anchor Opy2 N-terminal domain-containing protein n=1 Tax=Calocera viscosa (strain TUFC12733) TaxID=1330018 RepID=A0A167MTX2_CALVF|nr:hypothetical protein CALVIDRAFT_563274 [Calocera viscosa TUFC12733]
MHPVPLSVSLLFLPALRTLAAPACQPLPCCRCCTPAGPCPEEMCYPLELQCCPEVVGRCEYEVEPLRLERWEVERLMRVEAEKEQEGEGTPLGEGEGGEAGEADTKEEQLTPPSDA